MSGGRYQAYPEYKDSGVKWLGDIPNHWTIVPLKYLASFSGGGTPSKDNTAFWNGDIPWVSPKDMKGRFVDRTIDNITAKAVEQSSTNLLKEGALLIVVRSGILQHSIPAAINRVPVALNQDMKALRFNEQMRVEFAQYFVIGNQRPLLLEWCKEGATVESIEQEYLGISRTPIPPLPEQTQIAAFLDHETAKIDRLIEKQQALISLLKEKRQAVISHAVTKGLNPHAPLKDSGIEWLGQVPAHWVILALGKITLARCDGPFGSGLKSEHYTESGVRVIRLQNIKLGVYHEGDGAFIDKDYYARHLSNHDVAAGDLLIAGLGDPNNPVGRACVAPEDIAPAMVKADCFRFRLDRSKAVPGFIAQQLSISAAVDAGELANGSTRSRIPLSLMASRTVLTCPLDEQNEILDHIGRVSKKYDRLESMAAVAVALLQERRTALISAAVTGKIDVRHWQPTRSTEQ